MRKLKLFLLIILFFVSELTVSLNKNHNEQLIFKSRIVNWKVYNCNNYKKIILDTHVFIKIGPDTISNPRIISPFIKIKKSDKFIRIKLKSVGYINAIIIVNEKNEKIAWFNLLAKISYMKPLELNYVINKKKLINSKYIKIIISGFDKNFHDNNSYFAVGDIRVYSFNKLEKPLIDTTFIGNIGINYISYNSDTRYTWLTDKFDFDKVKRDIKVIKQLGNSVRIWCTADNLSEFDSLGNWKGFTNNINNLDSIFSLFSNENIKIIPTIFSQKSWSGLELSEKIIKDSLIAKSYINLCYNFVKAFEKYNAIIGWDICNESMNTTLCGHLKGKERMFAYEKARDFMCNIYSKIKSITSKPVIATFGNLFVSWSLIDPKEFCDIIGYSAYLDTKNDSLVFFETNNSMDFIDYQYSCQKPYFISELGAPIDRLNNNNSYRNPVVNMEYLSKFFNQFSINDLNMILLWRDKDVLWDRKNYNLNTDFKLIKKLKIKAN
ncbi:MAG: hypothetical protein ACOYU5_04055 [Stygiobacter sp.]